MPLSRTITRKLHVRCLILFIALALPVVLIGSLGVSAQQPDRSKVEVGMASWYGDELAGKATANGETFHPDKLTAAHPLLPLGSRARVRNLENGRSVVVRINDRGPFAKNRIIDLSEKAARQLGMIDAGVARVRVVPLGP